MLVAEINPVNPRGIHGVRLGIAALMLAHVFVLVEIIHETVTVAGADKTELVGSHVLVSRNINGVIGVTITIHIVGEHIGLFVSTLPCLIDEIEVVTTLVAEVESGNNTVRSHVLGVVKLDVVRTLGRGNIGESGLGGGTGHTGDLL